MTYHVHHIVPKHIGGTNEPSNLVRLSVKEHAEVHKLLWEEHGRWQDYCAWKSLSGQITCSEATKMAQSLANKGKNNPNFGKTGNKNPNYKNRGKDSPLYGKKQSKETSNKKRLSLVGRSFEDLHGKEKSEEIKNKLRKPKTEEHKKKLSKPKPKVICRIFDRKEMSLGNFSNWLRMYNNGRKKRSI
jgi:hypothetical protein